TSTGAGGFYLFPNLLPGDYFVEFITPDDYVISPINQGADDALDSDANPGSGRTACVNLSAGETDLTVDAGIFKPCPPSILLVKKALTPTTTPGGLATYEYE